MVDSREGSGTRLGGVRLDVWVSKAAPKPCSRARGHVQGRHVFRSTVREGAACGFGIQRPGTVKTDTTQRSWLVSWCTCTM